MSMLQTFIPLIQWNTWNKIHRLLVGKDNNAVCHFRCRFHFKWIGLRSFCYVINHYTYDSHYLFKLICQWGPNPQVEKSVRPKEERGTSEHLNTSNIVSIRIIITNKTFVIWWVSLVFFVRCELQPNWHGNLKKMHLPFWLHKSLWLCWPCQVGTCSILMLNHYSH